MPYLLKLRTILLYNYPYYLLLILTLIISIPRLIIPKESAYSTDSTICTGVVVSYSYYNNVLKITLKNVEKILVYYSVKEDA